jgi:SAM-dependent methyltransferase
MGLSRRASRVEHYYPKVGRLLDVGCATGLFLNAMRGRGWDVHGVELSPYAADYARRTFGLDVFTGTVQEAAYPNHSFDIVTMWDVLEHVNDPKQTLAEVVRILRPGGMLALSLPDPTCPEARYFGANWIGWDRPRHLHLFTPDILRCYLRDAGFGHIVFESLGGRLGLTLMSVQLALTARGISREKWRRPLAIAYSWPMRLLTWPVYRAAELMNKTTIMNVYARLPGALEVS